MNFFKGLQVMFDASPTPSENIQQSWLSSGRFLVFALIGGFLAWKVINGVLSPNFVWAIVGLGAFYIANNTVTKVVEIKENGQIMRERQRLAWADGTLTEVEAAVLKTADAKASNVAAVIASK
jgi:hypothetical protein